MSLINYIKKAFKTTQKTSFDCGVAVTVSLLKYFNIDYTSYLSVQKELNTSKITGTSPEAIEEVLSSYGLECVEEFSINTVGFVLINVNTFYNEKTKDEQNGHWLFYENKDGILEFFDVWNNKTFTTTVYDIKKHMKNINVDGTVYNNYVRHVSVI